MKLFCTAHGGNLVGRASSRAVAASLCRAKPGSSGASPHQTRPQSAFTMVEVAISLAIIGIALVAIIGVLPLGMNVQRDNREATVINQDASIFIEAIRNGSQHLDDLTNYIFAITNYQTLYPAGTTVTYGYKSFPGFLTNGLNIIGLLSTPEFVDASSGAPIPSLNFGGYSNHVVAYVRSISGPAVEKPPQDNQIMQADAFTYFVYSVNAPLATDTNIFYLHPLWQSQSYSSGASVFHNWNYWKAVANTLSTDVPGQSSRWARTPIYALELLPNTHELRLTFLWPVRPNGKLGAGRQTFRALIAGQIMQTYFFGQPLYFYQSQSFTNAP
jgi:prepilin-type N-terminal cleavage/methylation domain-containing protein